MYTLFGFVTTNRPRDGLCVSCPRGGTKPEQREREREKRNARDPTNIIIIIIIRIYILYNIRSRDFRNRCFLGHSQSSAALSLPIEQIAVGQHQQKTIHSLYIYIYICVPNLSSRSLYLLLGEGAQRIITLHCYRIDSSARNI